MQVPIQRPKSYSAENYAQQRKNVTLPRRSASANTDYLEMLEILFEEKKRRKGTSKVGRKPALNLRSAEEDIGDQVQETIEYEEKVYVDRGSQVKRDRVRPPTGWQVRPYRRSRQPNFDNSFSSDSIEQNLLDISAPFSTSFESTEHSVRHYSKGGLSNYFIVHHVYILQ
jgi:hypothetical protein